MDMKFILTVFPIFLALVTILFAGLLRVFLRRRAVHKQKKLDEQQRMQEERIIELEREQIEQRRRIQEGLELATKQIREKVKADKSEIEKATRELDTALEQILKTPEEDTHLAIPAAEPQLPNDSAGFAGTGSLLWFVDPKAYMPALISLLILAGALFIVLSQQYGADEQKWAFGSIGTILGFWLKP